MQTEQGLSGRMPGEAPAFRHDAVLYRGQSGFLDVAVPFCRTAVDEGRPVLVMIMQDKIDLLRTALDGYANQVQFRDMAGVGRNPARVIPAWRDFFDMAGDREPCGISEPAWSTRSDAELREAIRHEELTNLAFAGVRGWLVCPYDVTALDSWLVDAVRCSHPGFYDGAARRDNNAYPGSERFLEPDDDPLEEPPAGEVCELRFAVGPLDGVRRFVGDQSLQMGLPERRASDLLVAVNEAIANSIRHGGGEGTVRMWTDGVSVVCEVRDTGRIRDPLAGRIRPQPAAERGYGLWLVNQLCDLVQIRSSRGGTVVRMHVGR